MSSLTLWECVQVFIHSFSHSSDVYWLSTLVEDLKSAQAAEHKRHVLGPCGAYILVLSSFTEH